MARLLSMGATGLDVLELQSALNFHIRSPATPLKPDEHFGPLTDARLREFQRLAGIQVDGIVGPVTIAALYRAVKGTVEASLKPRKTEPPQADSVPASLSTPQDRSAESEGFEVESQFSFSPLSPLPLQLTLTITPTLELPWPVFLPKPLKLDIKIDQNFDDFELAGKIKVPFDLIKSDRLELTPYFSVGAGVLQNNFADLNVGAGAYVKLKLLNNIGGSSVSVDLDGGTKFNSEIATGKSLLKGFFDGAVTLEWSL